MANGAKPWRQARDRDADGIPSEQGRRTDRPGLNRAFRRTVRLEQHGPDRAMPAQVRQGAGVTETMTPEVQCLQGPVERACTLSRLAEPAGPAEGHRPPADDDRLAIVD